MLPAATPVPAGQAPWISIKELPWEQWYLQYLDGRRIGYSHVVVKRSAIEGDNKRVRIERTDCLELDNNGTPTRFVRTIEAQEQIDGRLIGLSDTSRSLDNVAQTEGKLLNNKFTANTTTSTPAGKETSQTSLDWGDNVWGMMGLQAVLMQHPPQAGELLTAQVFVPQLYKIAQVDMLVEQPDLTALPGGQTQTLTPVEVVLRTEDAGIRSRTWVDERGVVLKTIALSGPNLSTFWASAEVAMRTRDEFDMGDLLDRRVELSGETLQPATQRVVYAIERRADANGQDVFQLLAKTQWQEVLSLDSFSAEATVTSALADELVQELASQQASESSIPVPPEDACRKESSWIPAQHTNIKELASQLIAHAHSAGNPTAGDAPTDEQAVGDVDPTHAPRQLAVQLTEGLQRLVSLTPLDREIMNPLQTVRRSSGDCVEQAMLLVALLRSQDIPARLASGLVVDPQPAGSMRFHMWTEAWVDESWLALDATTGQVAPIDRLKVLDSCGDSNNPYDAILPVLRELDGLKLRIKSQQ